MARKRAHSYHVLFYGSPDGHKDARAQISLYDRDGNTTVWVRFYDEGKTIPDDYRKEGIIRMHMPVAMFDSVLDVLRNEKPIWTYFQAGRGFISSSNEEVGEAE